MQDYKNNKIDREDVLRGNDAQRVVALTKKKQIKPRHTYCFTVLCVDIVVHIENLI